MKVILDEEQYPKRVLVSLKEWDTVKQSIDTESELYRLMEDLTEKDVFDMSPEEFAAYLAPVAESAMQQALDQGLYVSYSAGPAGPPNSFIHQYADRKVLIQIDTKTGKERFLKNL